MEDYDDNEAVSNHIWNTLVQNIDKSVENMNSQANPKQEPLP